eukprot:GILJ01002830.1.p1 GENE.GILJ01002830.1~~GILJ01002830.1.p1  ORF type:complete len:741 (-),score=67.31 GILJ01002830.1:352-2574(-)
MDTIYPYQQTLQGNRSECDFLVFFSDTTNWKSLSLKLEFVHQRWKWCLTINWNDKSLKMKTVQDCHVERLEIYLGDCAYRSVLPLIASEPQVFQHNESFNWLQRSHLGLWQESPVTGRLYVRVILEARHFFSSTLVIHPYYSETKTELAGSTVKLTNTAVTVTPHRDASFEIDRIDISLTSTKEWRTAWTKQVGPISFPVLLGENRSLDVRIYVLGLNLKMGGCWRDPDFTWCTSGRCDVQRSWDLYFDQYRSADPNYLSLFLPGGVQEASRSNGKCHIKSPEICILAFCIKRDVSFSALKERPNDMEKLCAHRERLAAEQAKMEVANEHQRTIHASKASLRALLQNVDALLPDNPEIDTPTTSNVPAWAPSLAPSSLPASVAVSGCEQEIRSHIITILQSRPQGLADTDIGHKYKLKTTHRLTDDLANLGSKIKPSTWLAKQSFVTRTTVSGKLLYTLSQATPVSVQVSTFISDDILNRYLPSLTSDRSAHRQVIKTIVDILQEHLPIPFSEVTSAGSIEKGTHLPNSSDCDFVILFKIFQKKQPQRWFPVVQGILVNVLALHLGERFKLRDCKSPYCLGLQCDGIDVDLVIGVFFENKEEFANYYNKMDADTKRFLRASASKWQVEYIRILPPDVKDVIKIFKDAKNKFFLNDPRQPSSFVCELLVDMASSQTTTGPDYKARLLAQSVQCVLQRPRLIDPGNPQNVVSATVDWSALTEAVTPSVQGRNVPRMFAHLFP